MQITVKVDVLRTDNQKDCEKYIKYRKQHEAVEKRLAKLYFDLEKLIVKKSVLENTMESIML